MRLLLLSALALQLAAALRKHDGANATKGGIFPGAGWQQDVILQVALTPDAQQLSTIKIKLHKEWAPIGVSQFQSLVAKGIFNNAAVFRVVPNFIAQFGLPANPMPEFPAIQDDPVKVNNKRGTLVFATAGPNTRTTQMFINLNDNSDSLDGQGFAPIGEVVEGMDAVDHFNPEYGEQPDQGAITSQGNAYLDQSFPRLTKIHSATFR